MKSPRALSSTANARWSGTVSDTAPARGWLVDIIVSVARGFNAVELRSDANSEWIDESDGDRRAAHETASSAPWLSPCRLRTRPRAHQGFACPGMSEIAFVS